MWGFWRICEVCCCCRLWHISFFWKYIGTTHDKTITEQHHVCVGRSNRQEHLHYRRMVNIPHQIPQSMPILWIFFCVESLSVHILKRRWLNRSCFSVGGCWFYGVDHYFFWGGGTWNYQSFGSPSFLSFWPPHGPSFFNAPSPTKNQTILMKSKLFINRCNYPHTSHTCHTRSYQGSKHRPLRLHSGTGVDYHRHAHARPALVASAALQGYSQLQLCVLFLAVPYIHVGVYAQRAEHCDLDLHLHLFDDCMLSVWAFHLFLFGLVK